MSTKIKAFIVLGLLSPFFLFVGCADTKTKNTQKGGTESLQEEAASCDHSEIRQTTTGANGLSVLFSGRAMTFGEAILYRSDDERWNLVASDTQQSDLQICSLRISRSGQNNLSAGFSSDVSQLEAGLLLTRKNNGLGGERNLTLAFSGPDKVPFTLGNGTSIKVMRVDADGALLSVCAVPTANRDGETYGARGTVYARFCR